MVICPHCSFATPPDAAHCLRCGQDVPGDVEAPVFETPAGRRSALAAPPTQPQGGVFAKVNTPATASDGTPPPRPEETPATVAATAVGSTPRPAAAPRLVVVRGEQLGAAFPVLSGKNYLGRSGDKPVDIDLTGQEPPERVWTSRQHAVVSFERGELVVEDLISLNGTFVNRARLHPGHSKALAPGDIVQVGTVQLRLEVG